MPLERKGRREEEEATSFIQKKECGYGSTPQAQDTAVPRDRIKKDNRRGGMGSLCPKKRREVVAKEKKTRRREEPSSGRKWFINQEPAMN